MRAREFTAEAEGTFYHGTRSDFDFDQMSGGKGLVSFDRILGPHFSQTPDIANKFALYDPQTATAKRQQKQFGGKVYPVHIPGKVYVLPQKRGMLDMAAIALDAFMKVVLPNKELFDQYKEEVVKTEVKRTQRLRSLYKDHDYKKFPLDPIEVVEKRVKNNLDLYLDQKRYDWLSSPLFQLEFSNPELLHHIANEYKDLLMGQGYGVIQYRNTNPRETRGIEDKSSYIALMKPVSVFDKSGQINEVLIGSLGTLASKSDFKSGNIPKGFDVINSSTMGDFYIEETVSSSFPEIERIRVSHNGKHIASINGERVGNKFKVEKTELARAYQGQSLMPKIYAHLILTHGLEMHSDSKQSLGGHSIWKKLNNDPNITVVGYNEATNQEVPAEFDKSIEDYHYVGKPKSGLAEGWRDWVTAAGIGSMALGGGMAAYDKYAPSAPTQQAAPTQIELPTKKLKPLEKVLADAAQKAGIVGTELKQFLAQAAHETLDYHTLKELGTDRYVARKYDRKFNPVKAKTLGNIKPGDGAKYRGRGFIQLTGRYNYKEAGKALNLPLEQHPELVEKPEVAAATSIWFWKHRVQPKVADYHDVKQSTKPINPALKGLPSRQAHYDKYAQVDIPKNTPPIK